MTITEKNTKALTALRGKVFATLKDMGVTSDDARQNLFFLAVGKRSMKGAKRADFRNFLQYLRQIETPQVEQSESDFLASF